VKWGTRHPGREPTPGVFKAPVEGVPFGIGYRRLVSKKLKQETQLSLSNRATRLEVSRGHQT